MSGSRLRLYGATSGFVELEAPAVAPDGVLTLPSTFAGVGSNVVQTVKTDPFSASVAAGEAEVITGLSVNITPSSETSKVLVLATISGGRAANSRLIVTLRAGGTPIAIGDAAGSRSRATSGLGSADTRAIAAAPIMFVHSPGTTSPVTYDVVVGHTRNETDTVYINRTVEDANDAFNRRTISSIVVSEVAA